MTAASCLTTSARARRQACPGDAAAAASAARRQGAVSSVVIGVSRITMTRLTVLGSNDHARRKPADLTCSSVLPGGRFIGIGANCETKTVVISGWPLNHFSTAWYHSSHGARIPSARYFTASENGQPGAVTEKPCQRCELVTKSSAERHCSAWLSPTSAMCFLAFDAGAPKVQTGSGFSRSSLQGELVTRSAFASDGV